jgi:methionyl-tRNA formyltransferase
MKESLNFGKIRKIALFGGSQLMAALCRSLTDRQYEGLAFALFSSARHLDNIDEKSGVTLKELAESLNLPYHSCKDINHDASLKEFVTPNTLGLALGASWIFEKNTVDLFDGKLLDFMGIPLPQYRGGAHYSWQILSKNKRGCCNLQIIHGGSETFHKGEIIKRKEYVLPASARIPQDYFDAAIPHEVNFLQEFIDDVRQQKDFEPFPLLEDNSTYFPFLNTKRNGFINWSWDANDIETFICAFDHPYLGASTFLRGKRVYLKDCHVESSEVFSHPFQSGLIFRKWHNVIYVAAQDGTIIIRSVTDENGRDVMEFISDGQRFFTPITFLEEAIQYESAYDSEGLLKG